MVFPERELEIIRLAEDVSTGLLARREDFPAPPAQPDEIDNAVAAYHEARETAKTASATAARSFAAKEQALTTVGRAGEGRREVRREHGPRRPVQAAGTRLELAPARHHQ